jgi:hypothetical protein
MPLSGNENTAQGYKLDLPEPALRDHLLSTHCSPSEFRKAEVQRKVEGRAAFGASRLTARLGVPEYERKYLVFHRDCDGNYCNDIG